MIGGGLALSGCDNFLDGGDFASRLKNEIDYARAEKCIVTVFSEDKTGRFLSSGEKECREGYEFELQFTVNSEDYIFNGLKAVSKKDSSVSRSDSVWVSDPEKLPGNTESYSIKVKLLKAADDILISPDCTLIPKIVSITPVNYPSGCDQDSPIEITFNKTMEENSLVNFSRVIITDKNGHNLKSYFENPQFMDSEKRVLRISLKSGMYILDRNGDAEFCDIVVSVDSSEIKDSDGITLSNSEPYEYRINKNVDAVSPVITDIHFYSTDDTENFYYRELQKCDLTDWDDTTVNNQDNSVKYLFGTYSRNHVSKLYITLEGYDAKSGVDSLWVKETYKKKKDGSDADETSVTAKIDNCVLSENVDINGQVNVSTAVHYEFTSEDDGLYLLDFFLKDKVGNESECEEIYVLKDTSALYGTEYFNFGTLDLSERFNAIDEDGNARFPQMSLFKLDSDFFYGNNYWSQKLINAELCDEEGNITKLIENLVVNDEVWGKKYFNDLMTNVKYNPKLINFLRVFVTDESGVSGNIELIIPRCTHITDIQYKSNTNREIRLSDDGPKSVLSEYQLNKKVYYWFNPTDKEPAVANLKELNSTYISENTDGTLKLKTLPPEGEGRYKFYVTTYANKKNGNGDKIRTIYLPFEKQNGKVKGYVFDTANPNGQGGSVDFPDFSLPSSDEIHFEKNTGKAKFIINAVVPQNSYTYNLFFGSKSFSFNEEIELSSGSAYKVYITVTDQNGNLVAKKIPQINGGDMILSLNDIDNISPVLNAGVFNCSNGKTSYSDSAFLRYRSIPYDVDMTGSNVYTVSTFDCFFVPYKYGVSLKYNELTGNKYIRKTVGVLPQDITKGYLDIPVGVLDDGDYYLYCYLKDDLGNDSLNVSVYHYFCSETKPSFSVTKDSSDYKITLSAPFYINENVIKPKGFPDGDKNSLNNGVCSWYLGTDYLFLYFLESGTDRWTNETDITLTPENYNNCDYNQIDNLANAPLSEASPSFKFDYDSSYSDTFVKICGRFGKAAAGNPYYSVFMQPVFVYPDYYKYLADHDGLNSPAYCMNKSWMKVQNGWQVFCDRPCFVHTLYCPKKLTAGNTEEDASVWEARGMETGIVSSNGTMFTYTDDNLSGVPSGSWYTTIAHFADGTVLMTEVQQK